MIVPQCWQVLKLLMVFSGFLVILNFTFMTHFYSFYFSRRFCNHLWPSSLGLSKQPNFFFFKVAQRFFFFCLIKKTCFKTLHTANQQPNFSLCRDRGNIPYTSVVQDSPLNIDKVHNIKWQWDTAHERNTTTNMTSINGKHQLDI